MGNRIGIKQSKKLRKLNKDMELIVITIFKRDIRHTCWWNNGNIEMLLILVNKIQILIMLLFHLMIKKLILLLIIITSYKLVMTKIK